MPTYNTFSLLSELPYNCVAYLIDNNELIWKLLAYNDPNAWREDASHPVLSKVEKGALIYDGLKEQTSCRVFMTTGLDSSWKEQHSQLRISILEGTPVNSVFGNVLIGMEIYVHSQIIQLSNYKTRTDMLIGELIDVFNGAEIGGLGKLYFDASKNYRCRLTTIGYAPYIGKAVVFCNWVQ